MNTIHRNKSFYQRLQLKLEDLELQKPQSYNHSFNYDLFCSMNIIFILETVGTLVFAISGALTAAEKKFDLMGISIIAFVTALGGGTLRDILIGATPVGWLNEPTLLIVVSIGILLAFVFSKKLNALRKTFFLFDSIGLGMFAIAGMQKAIDFNIPPVYAVLCGMITATFGGMLRDILCHEIPIIFRKEIYATAALAGASLYLLLGYVHAPDEIKYTVSILTVIAIRIVAVKYNIGLWKIKWDE